MADLTLLRCELGIGVDLSTDPTTWVYEDMADPANLVDLPGARGRLFADAIPIRVGQSGEASQVTPSTVTFELDNSDGWLTPDNPMSPWWPHIAVGLPCRLSVLAGSPYLRTSGPTIGATSPDHADFDVTGDLTVRTEIIYHGTPGTTAFRIGPSKYEQTGDQRSWLWWIDIDGHVTIRTSPDGTLAAGIDSRSTAPLPRTGKIAIGAQVDVNNGAGGNTVRFEWAETVDTPDADWQPLGDPIVNVGTTSIFNSTTPLQICQQTLYPILKGRVYSGLGSGGSLRANPDFDAQTPGATSFDDTAPTPKPWTVVGEITGWRPRFNGEVTEVTLLAPHGRVSGTQRVRVTAAGDLRRLDVGNKPLRSAITRVIASPASSGFVVAHWPHEDGRDATRIASSTSGVAPMSIRGPFTMAGDDSVVGSAPLLTISPGDTAVRTASIPQIPQVPGVTWEVGQFIRLPDPAVSPAATGLGVVLTNGRVARWLMTINDTQLALSGVDDDGAGVVLATLAADPRWFDGTSIVVLRVADDGANVDWTLSVITTTEGFLFSTSGTFAGDTGVPTGFKNSCTGPPGGVTLGHMFVTSGTNLAGGISWLAPADSGFRGETDLQRVIRLCREENVPLAYVGDPAEGVKMGPQGVATLDALLRECAHTGLATFGESLVGPGLTYRPLRSHYNQDNRLAIDGTDKARNLDGPFDLVTDDKNYRTHMIASRPQGSEHTVIAAGWDPDRDPVRDERVEVNVAGDEQLPDQASWRLHVANSTMPRCPAVRTLLSEAADLQDEFLALTPGDRMSVVNLPLGFPPDGVDQLVTGWTETVSLARWEASITGIPAEPWEVAVRDDPVRGRRDTAGSILDADFDAGADTTMDVETTLGPLWSTSVPAPFELWVGGARVTVTAIGAPAGQVQTFTVSTTIANGVVKTIPAGTTVRLWRTPIRAL